jgi:hypothetical protein
MAHAYLLRDGTGDERIASHLSIPADILVGRRLSKPCAFIPTYSFGDRTTSASPVAGANAVVIRIDDPDEAKRVGAVAGCYHLVRDFSPRQLNNILTERRRTAR